MSDDGDERRHLPVTYNDPVSGRSFQTAAPLLATEEEIKRFASDRICGNCDNFEPGHVAAEQVRQRFMPKLVQELEWNPMHVIGCVSDTAGLCRDRPGLVTSSFTAGHTCPGWREDRGRVKRRTTPAEAAAWAEQRQQMLKEHGARMQKRQRAHRRRVLGLPEED